MSPRNRRGDLGIRRLILLGPTLASFSRNAIQASRGIFAIKGRLNQLFRPHHLKYTISYSEFSEVSMGFSLCPYNTAHRSLIAAILGCIFVFLTTGCTHRIPPDMAVISKEQTRNLRFSRIGVDLSDLKIQMPRKYYALLGTSLYRGLEKRFSRQMGGSDYRIIVRLTDLSLHMPPTREHETDYNDYIDGEAYVIGPNNKLLVRKRVLLVATGSNSIVPWPSTSFSKKQLLLF